jgi:hypothetical protein
VKHLVIIVLNFNVFVSVCDGGESLCWPKVERVKNDLIESFMILNLYKQGTGGRIRNSGTASEDELFSPSSNFKEHRSV